MGNVESDTETSSNGSGRLRRRSFSSGQTNSKELGHKRSFINKVLTRAGSSSSIGEYVHICFCILTTSIKRTVRADDVLPKQRKEENQVFIIF